MAHDYCTCGADRGSCIDCAEDKIDRLTAQLAEREAEIAQLKHYCEKCMYIKEYQKENTTLRAEIAALKQISAELCPDCGWAMKFPDEPCCKCEVERLKTEVLSLQCPSYCSREADARKQAARDIIQYIQSGLRRGTVYYVDDTDLKDIKQRYGLEG